MCTAPRSPRAWDATGASFRAFALGEAHVSLCFERSVPWSINITRCSFWGLCEGHWLFALCCPTFGGLCWAITFLSSHCSLSLMPWNGPTFRIRKLGASAEERRLIWTFEIHQACMMPKSLILFQVRQVYPEINSQPWASFDGINCATGEQWLSGLVGYNTLFRYIYISPYLVDTSGSLLEEFEGFFVQKMDMLMPHKVL